jgi:hypothetical protein
VQAVLTTTPAGRPRASISLLTIGGVSMCGLMVAMAIKLKTWHGGLSNNGQVRCLQALTAAWQKLPQSAINAGVEFEDVSYFVADRCSKLKLRSCDQV